MKNYIILSIFAVITAFFAKSYASEIPAIDKPFKVEQSVNPEIIFLSAVEIEQPNTFLVKKINWDGTEKINTLEIDNRNSAILTDEFNLKHPKRIHESKYLSYKDRLYSYSNRIFSNRIFLHSHNKVRFNS